VARGKENADTQLLARVAEYLAWPAYSGCTKIEHAIRRALKEVPGSDRWPADEHQRVFERLRRYYRGRTRADLEAEARRKPFPEIPVTLLNTPTDPKARQSRAETLALADGLSRVSLWAAELAELLRKQWWQEGLDPALLSHARKLIQLVEREWKRGEGAGKNRND
jgi:hypothetical protein